MRGNRAKIVVIDESPEVKADDVDAVVAPVKNTKRDICHQRGIADYPSKTVSITSACLKSNYFYTLFMGALREFANGNASNFACALDYRSAARVGITDMEFFLKERRRMPEAKFAMEYGSIFVGAESGSMFPYDLTEGCRVLRQVEYAQPTSCSSDYVMGVDLATSSEKQADNAVPLLRSVKANPQVNQQLVSSLRVALEQRSLELPVNSRNAEATGDEDEGEDSSRKRKLTMQEKAIFLESDALQIEMGNIVMKASASGTVIYDTARTNQHKDRYSALAMAVRYIAELENERKRKMMFLKDACIGVVSKFK